MKSYLVFGAIAFAVVALAIGRSVFREIAGIVRMVDVTGSPDFVSEEEAERCLKGGPATLVWADHLNKRLFLHITKEAKFPIVHAADLVRCLGKNTYSFSYFLDPKLADYKSKHLHHLKKWQAAYLAEFDTKTLIPFPAIRR